MELQGVQCVAFTYFCSPSLDRALRCGSALPQVRRRKHNDTTTTGSPLSLALAVDATKRDDALLSLFTSVVEWELCSVVKRVTNKRTWRPLPLCDDTRAVLLRRRSGQHPLPLPLHDSRSVSRILQSRMEGPFLLL